MGCVASTIVPVRSAQYGGFVDRHSLSVESSDSRFTTSNGPMVTLMVPPAAVAGIDALPLMRHFGLMVTVVPATVPTMVTYARCTNAPGDGNECATGQPVTRYFVPTELVGISNDASVEYPCD